MYFKAGIVTTDIEGRNDNANAVAIQSDNRIVVAGYSTGPIENDFAVARYNSGLEVGIQLEPNKLEEIISASPNPFTDQLIITGNNCGEIILFDLLGQEIYRQDITQIKTQINTENLIPGLYMLHYLNRIQDIAVKLFKQ